MKNTPPSNGQLNRVRSESNGATRALDDHPGQSITDVVTNGFFTVDENWTITFWNEAAEKLLRKRAEDILGKNVWEEFADVLPLSFYEGYHQALVQEMPMYFREYWKELDAWFDVITYHSGNTLSVSFKNASLPANVQQQLKIVHELYRFVTSITNDCLWEWNLKSEQVFWIDGGHKRIFGYPIENALVPQSFWERRIHPEDKQRVLTRLKSILRQADQNHWEEEYRFQRADGTYAYVHDTGHITYSGEGSPMRMTGTTQDITERVFMENTLIQERLERQKEITGAVLTAQENERREIGKEMHDNLNQILGAAKLYIELAKTDDEQRAMCLEKSSAYIVDVIKEIRRISKTLITPSMMMGLSENIHIVLDDLQRTYAMTIDFGEHGVNETLISEKIQLNIFRIIQEQLNNIVKHAAATHVTVDLTQTAKKLTLRIEDNGNGCDLAKESKGVGITNIKSRAQLCEGKVTIESSPGEGYRLKVVMPLLIDTKLE